MILRRHPHIFWYTTGETPESFESIVRRIALDVTSPRHLPRVPSTNRKTYCILDAYNKVLMVIIWLRHYHTFHALALLFGISKSTVAEDIHHIVPMLLIRYRIFITWHSLRKWSSFLNVNPYFPNAVG